MPTTPLLGSYGDISASQIAQAASALVPSGVVLSFAGATAPGGWLLCDGSLINRTTYATLFAAIGIAHGSGDGSTTFALPNYAGRFLRGRANGSANDPDRAGRTAAASGGATGDNVGSVQGNATAKNGLSVTNNTVTTFSTNTDHTHSGWTNVANVPSSNVSGPSNATALSGSADSAVNPQANSGGHSHSFTTYGVNSNAAHAHSVTSNVVLNIGNNETRPTNAYVNYIIKI